MRYLEEQVERLTAERDRARAEADELNELNARVERAKSLRDLVYPLLNEEGEPAA